MVASPRHILVVFFLKKFTSQEVVKLLVGQQFEPYGNPKEAQSNKSRLGILFELYQAK